MIINLLRNNSEKNKLNKSLSDLLELTGELKEVTNVLNPEILIEVENPTTYNYAHIPAFNRYYFINGFTSVRTGLWRISLSVDVLQTYQNEIKSLSGIISNSETIGANNYLTDEVWKSTVKETTNIINFPYGLLDDGEFILITAGG